MKTLPSRKRDEQATPERVQAHVPRFPVGIGPISTVLLCDIRVPVAFESDLCRFSAFEVGVSGVRVRG